MRKRTILFIIFMLFIHNKGIIAWSPAMDKINAVIDEVKSLQSKNFFYETDNINISNAIDSLSRDIARLQKIKPTPILDKVKLRSTMSELHEMIEKKKKLEDQKKGCEDSIERLAKRAYSLTSDLSPDIQKEKIEYIDFISGKKIEEIKKSLESDENEYKIISDEKKKKELMEAINKKRQEFQIKREELMREIKK